MSKNKEIIEDNLEFDSDDYLEDDNDFEEESYKIDSMFAEPKEENEREVYNTGLQIGGDIHKQSNLYGSIPYLDSGLKYGFFDVKDKNFYRFKAGTFQTYEYLRKVINVSIEEQITTFDFNYNFFLIETEEQLKQYFKETNQSDIYIAIKEQEETQPDLIKELLEQIKQSREKGYHESIYTVSREISEIYDGYNNQLTKWGKKNHVDYDDFGIMGQLGTIVETSKAEKGNERKAMVTTIAETRETNHKEMNEDKEDGNFISKLKFNKNKNKYKGEDY